VTAGSHRSWDDRIVRLGSLPAAIAVLVAINALYLLLVAFGNITDFGTNRPFVHHVLEMDTTNFGAPEGEGLDADVMWRSIENNRLQDAVYVAIIAWETMTGLVLLLAMLAWITRRRDGYLRARSLSTIGLVMALLLFFGGFITAGGEWFQMWKSDAWNGLDPAFRNSVLALGALILVHLPSEHWRTTA
jgi:predicted small integral membrane protein